MILVLWSYPQSLAQVLWSVVLQKQNEVLKITQSLESCLNCAEVTAALTPANKN